MTGHAMHADWQFPLAVAPLALYLFLVSSWHSGPRPRVVPGPVDLVLLMAGVGGLVLFGPFGQLLVRMLFGRPTLLHWLTLASGLVLVVLIVSRKAWRSLVVYHIDPATLDRAVRAALSEMPGRFRATLRGFEDETSQRHLSIEVSRRWLTATIESYGSDPEVLIHELGIRLRRQFRAVSAPAASAQAWFFLGLSALALVVPWAGWLASQPQARAALRMLFGHHPGG
jgi:hypothetical protein